MALFQEHPRWTRKEIVRHLDLSGVTVSKYLTRLCDLGAVRKIMPSRSPRSHYFERVDPSPTPSREP